MKNMERVLVYILSALLIPVGGAIIANRVMTQENHARYEALKDKNSDITVRLQRLEDKADRILQEVRQR